MTAYPKKEKVQIVIVAESKLLLLQFAKIHNEGFQNITGSVDPGESFHFAALRELFEETGITASIIDVKHEFHFHDRWGTDVHERIFLCLLNKIPPIVLSDEHQDFKWIDVDKVAVKDFVFPTNFEAFQKAMEFVKK